MTRQVKVEMVVVVSVGVGPEHRCEILAGAAMERTQEHGFAPAAAPAPLQRDHASISEFESGNIDGVRAAMF